MADGETHQDRLGWTGGWSRQSFEPLWPHEPDVNVIRALAKEHLAVELPASSKHALPSVTLLLCRAAPKNNIISLT